MVQVLSAVSGIHWRPGTHSPWISGDQCILIVKTITNFYERKRIENKYKSITRGYNTLPSFQ